MKNVQPHTINISVIIILKRDKEYFLFKRKNTGWADGDYTVPSGHVDTGETPQEAAIREAQEEVGVSIQPEDLRLVHTDFVEGKVMNLTFMTDTWEGEAQVLETDKAEDGRWFSINNLPQNIAGHGRVILNNIQHGINYHEIQ